METSAIIDRRVSLGVDLDTITSGQRSTVMVVEDEPDTVRLLKQVLRVGGYDVLGASNGFEALKKIKDYQADLILLDLMMPGMDGWETYQHLRKVTDAPVIIVSAIHSKDDVVRALQMGMDDYLTKPFSNAEVIARVQAVLRRARASTPGNRVAFSKPDIVVDFSTQEVIANQQPIQLTGKEFAIISILAKAAPNVVQYQVIADQVWGEDNVQIRNRIKYLIYLLRQKLQDATGTNELIQNVDRFGYKLKVEK